MTKKRVCANKETRPNVSLNDKLCAAIGILQLQVMASSTDFVPEKMWGGMFFSTSGLEHAINLLVDLVGDIEALDELREKGVA